MTNRSIDFRLTSHSNYDSFLFCPVKILHIAIRRTYQLSGYVTRQQFTDAYGIYFTEIPTRPDAPNKYFVDYIFDSCDSNGDGHIDYVEWIDGLNFEELHAIVSSSKSHNPFLKVDSYFKSRLV